MPVPEILAEDLEIVDAEPVPGTAVARHAAAVPQAGDLFGMVASYAERGITFPIESLERLIALQERAQERNARDAYFAALEAFQAECPPIRKSKTAEIVSDKGARFSYTYAPLEEIAKTIRPVLARHGLSYKWDTLLEGVVLVVTCTLRHVVGHSDESTFSCPTTSRAAMSDAQKVGAARTYGARMSLIDVCGLTTTDDDMDGAEPEAGECVTEEQVDILRGLLIRSGSDEQKFLRLMGAATITELPAARFDVARTALEDKLAKMEARERERGAAS